MARRVIGYLVALSCSLAAAHAAADAKQCVAQNNNGAQLRDEHHLLAARDAYRACVAERECPNVVRSECDTALSELKTAIPTLIVAVLDDQQHDLTGATLQIDGRSVALDGSTVEVDPGSHELAAKSGYLSASLQVMATESELSRRVEIVLQAPQASAPEAAPAASAAAAPAPRSKVPVYLLGGVAALGAASFSYFALSGHSELSDLNKSNCKPYCDPADVNRIRSKYLFADISLGVSLVALGGAGYFLLRGAKEHPAAEHAGLSLNVIARPGSAGLSVRWLE